MMNELTYVKQMLGMGDYTLVICSGGRVHVSEDKGIRPLLDTVLSDEEWKGAYAADKIVGKAAAMLYAKLGVAAVYAGVISKPAMRVFEKFGIEYEYGTFTPNIINREGTGMCPMEQLVKDCETADEAFEKLKNKIYG